MNIEQLKKDLVRDEDEVLHAYADSMGYITIGVGHLIDARKGGSIPQHISRQLLELDIDQKVGELKNRIHNWNELDDVRQRALANMAFQLGVSGLMGFRNMLRAIYNNDWGRAHDEALNSRWAKQTPNRARRIAMMLLTGDSE